MWSGSQLLGSAQRHQWTELLRKLESRVVLDSRAHALSSTASATISRTTYCHGISKPKHEREQHQRCGACSHTARTRAVHARLSRATQHALNPSSRPPSSPARRYTSTAVRPPGMTVSKHNERGDRRVTSRSPRPLSVSDVKRRGDVHVSSGSWFGDSWLTECRRGAQTSAGSRDAS